MISLTERAENQIIQLLKKRGGLGIRIGVKTTGCSGLAYVIEYLKDDKFDPADERIIYKNFIVKTATRDLVYLRGLEVDYVKNGLNEGFEFKNPNERDRCGCGISFRV
jgi:iron-sulfur cluster assembly protein